MKLGEKYCKIAFFWRCDFWHFFDSQKIKKSNHQKCKNLIKRCQIFIAAFERRVLNSFFGSSEPSRKNFILTIKRWTCKIFHFLQKTIEKTMFLHFWKFPKSKKYDFPLVFQQKWNGTKFEKSISTQKPIEKCDFYIFRNHKNSKIVNFQWFLIKNELWHPKKS